MRLLKLDSMHSIAYYCTPFSVWEIRAFRSVCVRYNDGEGTYQRDKLPIPHTHTHTRNRNQWITNTFRKMNNFSIDFTAQSQSTRAGFYGVYWFIGLFGCVVFGMKGPCFYFYGVRIHELDAWDLAHYVGVFVLYCRWLGCCWCYFQALLL